MSNSPLNLKVGDKVRLTGPEWEGFNGHSVGDIVEVTHFNGGSAWGDKSVGSLTDRYGTTYGPNSFEVEKVEQTPEPRVLADDIRGLTDTILNHFDQAGFSYSESRALLKAFINEFLG